MADLVSIFIFCGAAYMGLVSWIGNREIKQNDIFKAETKAKLETHTTQIQTINNIQGTKLDAMSTEFKEFKHDISSKLDALTAMVHKEKNQENILNTTLGFLLKELEKRNDKDI
jgi:adenylosuccinate synthase